MKESKLWEQIQGSSQFHHTNTKIVANSVMKFHTDFILLEFRKSYASKIKKLSSHLVTRHSAWMLILSLSLNLQWHIKHPLQREVTDKHKQSILCWLFLHGVGKRRHSGMNPTTLLQRVSLFGLCHMMHLKERNLDVQKLGMKNDGPFYRTE